MALQFKLAILAAGLALLSGPTLAAAASAYKVVDLGTLGADYSFASKVNDSKEVAGTSSIDDSISRAFLYAGGMTDVVNVPEVQSRGLGINDFGQVVGDAAFDLSSFTAYIAENGSVQNIGTLGGVSSQAMAINNQGVTVGWSQYAPLPSGPWTWPPYINFDQRHHAFVYRDGVMQDLHVLAGFHGDYSEATNINDNGQIIGTIDGRGFIYVNGQFVELERDGPKRVEPMSINDAGLVVLHVYDPAGNSTAFIYEEDNWMPLGSLGGGESIGHEINDSNTVVGQSTTGEFREPILSTVPSPDHDASLMTGTPSITKWNDDTVLDPHPGFPVWHAFIYEDGQMTDLNTLIPQNSGWELTHANGINNAGVIVGTGEFNGHRRAYMLVPIPEPSSLRLLLTFITATASMTCRRASVAGRHCRLAQQCEFATFTLPGE